MNFDGWGEGKLAQSNFDIADGKAINITGDGLLIAPQDFIEYAKSFITNLPDNMLALGGSTTIGTEKIYATVLPDATDKSEITEILDNVNVYYVINSKPSIPVTLNFTTAKALKSITVTSDTTIAPIPASALEKLTVNGILSDSAPVTINGFVSAKGGSFTNAVIFNGGGTISDTATFKEAVYINSAASMDNATFSKAVTVGSDGVTNASLTLYNPTLSTDAKVTVKDSGKLAILNISALTANITIENGGVVTYSGSVFNLNDAKTVAGGNVQLDLTGTALKVTSTTGGTLNLTSSTINLTDASFVLGGSTAIILGTDFITAPSYKITGSGTLFSSPYSGSLTTFSGNKIEGPGSASALTLSDAASLAITAAKTGTLSKINVDLKAAGKITFGPKSMLYLAASGSISTGSDTASIAYDGLIVAGSETVGGSLLVGTLAASSDVVQAGSIRAGSLGTSSSNVISQGGSFAKVDTDVALSGSEAQFIQVGLDGGSASLGGSILIFKN
jgi:hypothetical protein